MFVHDEIQLFHSLTFQGVDMNVVIDKCYFSDKEEAWVRIPLG